MTSVRLSAETEKRLGTAARRAGVTKSDIIREAIDEKVTELLKGEPPAPRFTGRLAGLEHLIGSVEMDEPVSTKRIGDQYGKLLAERWEEREKARKPKRRRS